MQQFEKKHFVMNLLISVEGNVHKLFQVYLYLSILRKKRNKYD